MTPAQDRADMTAMYDYWWALCRERRRLARLLRWRAGLWLYD